ncbi:hypothetical protein KCP78_15620 [Salmonella enterica subsp. enterica]|nr:hypothetical protein KCP78_15620 [Salmonella enterica subsp. enterica]
MRPSAQRIYWRRKTSGGTAADVHIEKLFITLGALSAPVHRLRLVD